MSAIYDNWERLVAAVIKKQQIWELCHAPPSPTSSSLSDASDSDLSYRSPSNLSESSYSSSSVRNSSILLEASGSNSNIESRRFSSSPPKLVLFYDFWPAFSIEDVYLISSKLLGQGTFGSVYSTAICNGTTVVVKRLKSGIVSELDFERQVNIVGHVSHENVAQLRACYFSDSERILLYDYYAGGSVHSLLHGEMFKFQVPVDWVTRLKIAIGVARGIAHIHAQNGGKLAHGNIKSSNVFLNPEGFGCVSDLGLAKMAGLALKPIALCYAPEVKSGKNVSRASDVYSFGIFLFELLTRKSCVDISGGPKAVDLVQLISSSNSREMAAEIFDAELLLDQTIRGGMVEMLQIGIKCVAKSKRKRPAMNVVVKMLEYILKNFPYASMGQNKLVFEGIFNMKPGGHASVEKKSLVFVNGGSPTFDLEDILQSNSKVLGRGTSGTSYKAQLGNGETIVVKRLRLGNADTIMVKRLRDKSFASGNIGRFLEVIGRVKHENVSSLIAYYFSKHETLLVHDFHEWNVSALLHGNNGGGKRHVDWKTRLKIAVGAARGIAYIHNELELVHGNIKSSNIFLTGSKCCISYDFGLEKGLWGTSGGDLHQEADVYSFGVVLLELASGKMPQTDRVYYYTNHIVEWAKHLARDSQNLLQVFDKELRRYQEEGSDGMLQYLRLAMNCVEVNPMNRPKMSAVVKRLEAIEGDIVKASNRPTSVSKGMWRQPLVESRLGHLLEDMLHALDTGKVYFL